VAIPPPLPLPEETETMTTEERDTLLATLSPTERGIYSALVQGKLSSTALRNAVGRTDGMTTELRRLMAHGLIRFAGRERRNRGINPAMYEQVPLGEVEEAATKFAARRPKRRRRSAGSKLAELRRRERGEFSRWHRTRKRILEETQLLAQVEQMAFWEAVPADELELVLEEVLDLRDWADAAIEAIGERQADDATRAKIDKLRATNGRTSAEEETARKHVERLSGRLIPRDD
jgi:hypothetical protein